MSSAPGIRPGAGMDSRFRGNDGDLAGARRVIGRRTSEGMDSRFRRNDGGNENPYPGGAQRGGRRPVISCTRSATSYTRSSTRSSSPCRSSIFTRAPS